MKSQPTEQMLACSRALTLHRPWDTAILEGTKRIENRSWRPKEAPGWLYLHSGTGWSQEGQVLLTQQHLVPPDPYKQQGRIQGMIHVASFLAPGEMSPDLTQMIWQQLNCYGWVIDQVVLFDEQAPRVVTRGAQRVWTPHLTTLTALRTILQEGLWRLV